MNVINFTWAFKIKQYPEGTLCKLKARFFVRGFQQIKGIDYFETYAPVVSWMTVRLIFAISLILNLESIQVDYTASFVQAPLKDTVYIDMPCDYKVENKYRNRIAHYMG